MGANFALRISHPPSREHQRITDAYQEMDRALKARQIGNVRKEKRDAREGGEATQGVGEAASERADQAHQV